MRKGGRLRIKVSLSFWTKGPWQTGRTYRLCKPQWQCFTALPFSPITSHSLVAIDPLLSTCAEYLHFLAVNIVLRPRIDCFDFQKAICMYSKAPTSSAGDLGYSAKNFYSSNVQNALFLPSSSNGDRSTTPCLEAHRNASLED